MADTVEFDKKKYLDIAESTQVFRSAEIKVLEELMDSWAGNPDVDYYKIDAYDKGLLAGFAIFGRAPLTVSTWDLYWLIVRKGLQGKGIGKSLVRRVEDFILTKQPKATVRVETSTRVEYAHARNLYLCMDYIQAGHIPNFYESADGLLIYYKNIGVL